jgi:hypothetical protein
MTTSSSNVGDNGKPHVDYAEDLEKESTVKPVDVANMERVELTEEDVRAFFA